MKETYFSVIELVEKPFSTFNSVGSFTPAEFAISDYADDPLVIRESDIPDYAFGVCSAKVVAGELVARTGGEMAVFEAEYDIVMGLQSERLRIHAINNESFTYDSNNFPMDEVSRLFYTGLEKIGGNQKIRTMENTLYNLLDATIPTFMRAYYTKLLFISKHDI